MPRTRAQRSQASPDHTAIAATVPLPATPPVTRRKPLGEISGNQEELPATLDNPEEILKAKKRHGKGKKGKSGKKARDEIQAAETLSGGEILCDENESEISSAVEDACHELMKVNPQGIGQIVMHDERSRSPPSPAVAAVTQQLSPTSTPETPDPVAGDNKVKLDRVPAESRAETGMSNPGSEKIDISRIAEDSMQFHVKNVDPQTNASPPQKSEMSPQRLSPRTEDSIEAIDKFEEELEQVGELIPSVRGPAKVSPQPRGRENGANTVKPNASRKTTGSLRSTQRSTSHRENLDLKPTAASTLKKGASVPAPAPANQDLRKGRSAESQTSCSSSASDTKGPAAAQKCVSSVHKAPFVPVKSNKPPTRPNFELPGEAVARKLKEVREERMKREEEEKEKPRKTTFKARPVHVSQPPVIKPTATSKARISIAKGENPVTAVSAASVGKRRSTLSVQKRPTAAAATVNTSARVDRGALSSNRASTSVKQPRPSMQPSIRQSVTPADTAQLKAKGKEVFNRGRIGQDERNQMKKDKEEAAKKARVEAAERGRQASREWAERQKAKKMVATKGKEPKKDVGMPDTKEITEVITGREAAGGEVSVSS
ncbi:MAG: hypothetical protein Q9218_000184 [Villophora microphyllina]